jgi:hypothetical protein
MWAHAVRPYSGAWISSGVPAGTPALREGPHSRGRPFRDTLRVTFQGRPNGRLCHMGFFAFRPT